jgi:probable rRNA maturation factor
MLESESQPPSEIVVLLADSEYMTALNQRFRKVNHPTDVLSFPSGSGPELHNKCELGDIVICLPIAEKQAQQNDHDLETELACLAVHGGLHLLGYDDATDQGRDEMVNKMITITQSIGLHPSKNWSSLAH